MQPWEDEDNATKGPEIPLQRRITAWILKQLFLAQPDAPTSRMGQIVQLHQTQSIVTVGPIRAVDPRDYSILQTDMLLRDNVNEPRKKHCLTYSVAGWLTPQYLVWKDQSGVAAGPSLTLQGWQSWFCQFLGRLPLLHWHLMLTRSAHAIGKRSAHAIGKRLTPTTCTIARCTLATGILLTSSSYRPLLTLHMPLVTSPTAASAFRLAAAKNAGTWRSSVCTLLGRQTSSLMLPWFTNFMAVLLNLLVMISLATPIRINRSSIRP